MWKNVWIPVTLLVCCGFFFFFIWRTLLKIKLNSRREAIRKRREFAEANSWGLISETGNTANNLLRGFDLLTYGSSYCLVDLMTKRVGSRKFFIGDFTFWRIAGDGAQEAWQQTVFLVSFEDCHFEKKHFAKLSWLDRLTRSVISIDSAPGETISRILKSRDWRMELLGNRMLVYSLDREISVENYVEVIDDLGVMATCLGG